MLTKLRGGGKIGPRAAMKPNRACELAVSGVLGLVVTLFAAEPDLSPIAQKALRVIGERAFSEETRHFIVWGQDREIVTWLGGVADQAFQLIDKRLWGDFGEGSTKAHRKLVLFLLNERAWQKIVAGEGLRVEGVAFQNNREVFVLAHKERGELIKRVSHEIAHERVQHYFARKLPVWLEEGTAGMCGWDAAVAVRKAEGWTMSRSASACERVLHCSPRDVTRWSLSYPPDPADAARFVRCAEAFIRALQEHLGYRNFVEFLWAIRRSTDPWDVILQSEFGFSNDDFLRVESLMNARLASEQ